MNPTPPPAQSPRPRTRLVRDLVLVLAVKSVLLFGAWWLWFSHPQAPHMHMPGAVVANHLLGPSGVPSGPILPAAPAGVAGAARSEP